MCPKITSKKKSITEQPGRLSKHCPIPRIPVPSQNTPTPSLGQFPDGVVPDRVVPVPRWGCAGSQTGCAGSQLAYQRLAMGCKDIVSHNRLSGVCVGRGGGGGGGMTR